MAAQRPKIPTPVETEVLVKSGRRCALCFGLQGDETEKPGQIAHIDQNRSNNTFGNLCWLCQVHHDQYDSTTSQTKGLTDSEVRAYRDALYSELPRILAAKKSKAGSVFMAGDVAAGSGKDAPGGDVRVESGTGRHGANGGDVVIGPGIYRAGDGGQGGKGGDITIKAGDAEQTFSAKDDTDMLPRVYIETTFVSYLTGRPSRDVVIVGHQQITHEWWDQSRVDFELCTSQLVLQEAGSGDPEAAQERLQILKSMVLLDTTEAAVVLAEELVRARALPEKAADDAVHIAIAATQKIPYLLTWNCRHMANATMRPVIEAVCGSRGYKTPIICTPEELRKEIP